MTKQKIVDLCYQKMLDHYCDYGMSGINKPFNEIKELIKKDTIFGKIKLWATNEKH